MESCGRTRAPKVHALDTQRGDRKGPSAPSGLTAIYLYGALFLVAALSFCLAQAVGPRFGAVHVALVIAGGATCGWSWLLVRALFPPAEAPPKLWPLGVVLSLVALDALSRLHGGTALARMLDNVETMVSSSLLLLASLQPLQRVRRSLVPAERAFRFVFAAGYVAVLATAVLWVDGAPLGTFAARWGALTKAACALIALEGMAGAVLYRRAHPLPVSVRPRRRGLAAAPAELGDRILRLMREETAYARPDLRVADLAQALGEAEYKVTHCITGALGFRNFNQMVNHFRLADAKRRLQDEALDHLPILTIAYDSGFASVGPFNRAFKAETGVTPQTFRRARHARRCEEGALT